MNDPQKQLVDDARKTVDDCKKRWDKFREDYSKNLGDYTTQSFGYVGDVLGDKSEPRDWIKGGLALWVEGYGVTRRLWSSASRLWYPSDEG
jgi:hypothetical protein